MARKHYSDTRRDLYLEREAKRRDVMSRRRVGQYRKAETASRFEAPRY